MSVEKCRKCLCQIRRDGNRKAFNNFTVFDSRGKKTAHKRHSFGSWTTLVVFDSIKNVLLLRVVC